MFRSVRIERPVPGSLFLTEMPGRYEPMDEFKVWISDLSIDTVICLTPLDEIREKSEEYYHLIRSGNYPWEMVHFPIPDYGAPDDPTGFLNLTREMASRITQGGKILVHCAAGIGRTGTFAMVLLMALGTGRMDAAQEVRMAGSEPEGIGQRALIDWCARELGRTT